eukprot:14767959-Alexandrium_andersonii.AAC.1
MRQLILSTANGNRDTVTCRISTTMHPCRLPLRLQWHCVLHAFIASRSARPLDGLGHFGVKVARCILRFRVATSCWRP